MLLEAKNIEKLYFDRDGSFIACALEKVSLSVDNGEFMVITGPSGAGKSTLLNLLSGLDTPTSGEIRVSGQSLKNFSSSRLAAFRNEFCGFIFQTPHLLPDRTVAENISLPFCYGKKTAERDIAARCDELLEYVGLGQMGDRMPSTLSGGEMQRVVFARALTRNPKLIFADEPTGSLDSENSLRIVELLHRQSKKGCAVIMVTHDATLLEYAETVVELRKIGAHG